MSSPKGIALITGASSGIGATYAERFAQRGHDLVLVARDVPKLEARAEDLRRKYCVHVEVLAANLTVKTDLLRVEQRLGADPRIVILVNNAGTALGGDLATIDPDRLENLIQLNVTAPSRLARAVLPGFIERRCGTIINVSSVVALAPELLNGIYSGTKAYLLNLTLKLQQEVANTGVRVQAVLPGATRTAIWEKAGSAVENLPSNIVMDVDEMVDAALAGLDQGEAVTIPSLPDPADWHTYTAARLALGPNLSRDRAAARYRA